MFSKVSKSALCVQFCDKMIDKTMSQKPILYGDLASPPVRFAMMTASILDIDLVFKEVNLFKGEQHSEFYSKINPLRKVPSLFLNHGNILRDSHAIAMYFCGLNVNQDLYPKDPIMKAKVDEMLFFNSSLLFPLDNEIFSEYFAGKQVKEDSAVQWDSLLKYLENKLQESDWLVGKKMTLGDLCCATTVSSLQLLISPSNRHIKVNQWLNKLKLLPCYAINSTGLKRLNSFIEQIKMS